MAKHRRLQPVSAERHPTGGTGATPQLFVGLPDLRARRSPTRRPAVIPGGGGTSWWRRAANTYFSAVRKVLHVPRSPSNARAADAAVGPVQALLARPPRGLIDAGTKRLDAERIRSSIREASSPTCAGWKRRPALGHRTPGFGDEAPTPSPAPRHLASMTRWRIAPTSSRMKTRAIHRSGAAWIR